MTATDNALLLASYPLPNSISELILNPDDGLDDPHQAHIEALMGQREVSQLQLWLCKAKKVNRGKIWQVADSLDHFAAIWTPRLGRRFGLGHCPSIETSPGMTVHNFLAWKQLGLIQSWHRLHLQFHCRTFWTAAVAAFATLAVLFLILVIVSSFTALMWEFLWLSPILYAPCPNVFISCQRFPALESLATYLCHYHSYGCRGGGGSERY